MANTTMNLKIAHQSKTIFKNREEAGKKLAQALHEYKNHDVVVCALPRGGVEVGLEVAKALKAPFDVVITRKIGHPYNSEYAICAVDESGARLCNESEINSVDKVWLEEETKRQEKEVLRRIKNYRRGKAPTDLKGKIVVLVDDGIATGLTMRSAIQYVRRQGAKEIIVAVPVSPKNIATLLRSETDNVIALHEMTDYFSSVGAYYKNFPQVRDEEVIRDLHYRY